MTMASQLSSQTCRPTLTTSQRPLPVAAKRGKLVIRSAVASETFCKDVVNVRKEVKAEGSAMVTFMGAEGSVVTVECPKARPSAPLPFPFCPTPSASVCFSSPCVARER